MTLRSEGSPRPFGSSILITGTGALASLFAARLAKAGASITMLGSWPAGLAALREHGVRHFDEEGGETRYPVQVAASPQESCNESFALVLVKAWQTERVAGQLSGCLSPEGAALTLQNGLGNREKLAAALGADRVGLGVTTTGATLLGPGKVRPGGEGVISIEEHPRLLPLIDLLKRAGFTVEITDSAAELIWRKLVINAAINPLTALLRVPNGALLDHAETRELMNALAIETAAVASALGIDIADPSGAAKNVALRTATNFSSMYQDIQRGAPTEIDAICGAIYEAGQRLGVPTPVNHTMWKLVKAAVKS